MIFYNSFPESLSETSSSFINCKVTLREMTNMLREMTIFLCGLCAKRRKKAKKVVIPLYVPTIH